jgi:hypothetical protein
MGTSVCCNTGMNLWRQEPPASDPDPQRSRSPKDPGTTPPPPQSHAPPFGPAIDHYSIRPPTSTLDQRSAGIRQTATAAAAAASEPLVLSDPLRGKEPPPPDGAAVKRIPDAPAPAPAAPAAAAGAAPPLVPGFSRRPAGPANPPGRRPGRPVRRGPAPRRRRRRRRRLRHPGARPAARAPGPGRARLWGRARRRRGAGRGRRRRRAGGGWWPVGRALSKPAQRARGLTQADLGGHDGFRKRRIFETAAAFTVTLP